MNVRLRTCVALGLAVAGSGCTAHFFSGEKYPLRNRPVARIETRGGVEYGATTEAGILFLGRTADEGPCRVHYFLGEQLVTEDGTIEKTESVYCRAVIDLKHHNVPVWPQDARRDDPLVAMVLRVGGAVEEVPVRIAIDDDVSGDVLEDPGRPLPVGTAIFHKDPEDESLAFVGLVTAEATLERGGTGERFLVFTGADRIRELMLQPQPYQLPSEVDFRPDGIRVRRTVPIRKTDGSN